MRSSKSRSRSKSNRNRSMGNIVNRVFDSSGPEGKVRGTPQQIIDKYNQLARDAHLGNDRVAAENFQQHAEHYTRMLSEAQREQDQRREQQEREQEVRREREERERAERQDSQPQDSRPQDSRPQDNASDASSSDVIDASPDSGLVETPENKPRRGRGRPKRVKDADGGQGGDTPPKAGTAAPEAPEAAE